MKFDSISVLLMMFALIAPPTKAVLFTKSDLIFEFLMIGAFIAAPSIAWLNMKLLIILDLSMTRADIAPPALTALFELNSQTIEQSSMKSANMAPPIPCLISSS